MANPSNAHTYSSSEDSPSSSLLSFLAGFFFFFLFLDFAPVAFPMGCSRILRISSSVIFLSDFSFSRGGLIGAARRVIPFLVMAVS